MPGRVSSAPRYRPGVRSALPRVLILSAAIVAGAVIVRHRQPEKASTANPTIVVGQYDSLSIPVPASFVPTGTKVKDIRFRNMAFPRHQVPDGALHSVSEFLEAVTLAPLPANLPLFKDNFSLVAGAKNPVIERIPSGMRAMTLRVDATSSVEGWAGSGSTVDVLLVEKDRTTVIAERIKVLSAERSVSPVEGASAPHVPSTVTVLVTQEQCLAINTAIPRGKIAFALRSLTDEENWGQTVYTAGRLTGNTVERLGTTAITGFASVDDEQGTSSFALANGRWIRSEGVPDGFFAMRRK